MGRRKLDLLAALAIGAVFLSLMPWSRMLAGQNDFVHFYIGGLLFGRPEIFSPEANYAKQKELIGVMLDHSFFGRPAFYGLLLKPLTLLPYLQAYLVFQIGSLLSLWVFLKLNTKQLPELPVLCAMSLPLFLNFMNGQDVLYLLLLCSLSLCCVKKKWDFAAGLLLSLCAIKAHLFILTPLAVLCHRKWRVLAGATLGAVVLAVAGLAGGVAAQLELLKQLGNPEHSPYGFAMPTVRSLTGEHYTAFLLCAIAVYLMIAYLIYKSSSYEAAFGWAITGGVLASFHAYLQDCLLILLALVLVHRELAKVPKILFYLAVLPFFHIAVLAGAPYSASFPLLMLTCFVWQIGAISFQKNVPAPNWRAGDRTTLEPVRDSG